MMSRSFIQRSCLLLGLIALSAYLFYIGKGHTLLIDTNALTINGQEFKSPEMIEVSIDGKAAESMGRAERILVSVGGPQHTILIEVISGGDRKVEKRLVVPTFMDTAVISIPAILGDAPAEYWLTHFTPPPMEEAPAEQMLFEKDAPDAAAPADGVAPVKP
jgi:hypothetical protein